MISSQTKKAILASFSKRSQRHKILSILLKRKTPIDSDELKRRTTRHATPTIQSGINPILVKRFGLQVVSQRVNGRSWVWGIEKVSA